MLGVRTALDDFVSGYSSLSYLRLFPFDKVKFDRSIVEDLSKDGNSHAMIRAITALASVLGIDSLAEAVELAEQFEVLERGAANLSRVTCFQGRCLPMRSCHCSNRAIFIPSLCGRDGLLMRRMACLASRSSCGVENEIFASGR